MQKRESQDCLRNLKTRIKDNRQDFSVCSFQLTIGKAGYDRSERNN